MVGENLKTNTSIQLEMLGMKSTVSKEFDSCIESQTKNKISNLTILYCSLINKPWSKVKTESTEIIWILKP